MTDYNIQRVANLEEILQCIPFEQEIRNKERDSTRISDMLLFLSEQLQNPYFGFWIAYKEDGKIAGYTVALISLLPGQKRLLLLRMHAKDKKLKKEFTELLREWARGYKVRVAQMTVTSQVVVRWAIRDGWKIISTNMEKRY